MTAANAMISKGFLAAGYNYVIQDDCWSIKTGRDDTTHEIMPDTTKVSGKIKQSSCSSTKSVITTVSGWYQRHR